jgi:CubicO group peptidase (beta-lactamase class C family)
LIAGDDRLAAFCDAEVRRGAMPGVAWWVGSPDGADASGAFGHAAIEPAEIALASETPFDLASLTKPLATALLAVMLDRERRLSLDTTLAAVFSELEASPFGGETLRQVAAHRAGFPAWMPLYVGGTTPEAYVAAIAGCERRGASGETLYSDLGYILLGFAVERAAGATLDELFSERIARPLGLTCCGFAGGRGRFGDAAATERGNAYEQELAGATAQGYPFRRQMIRGQVHDGNAWGLGGIAGHAGLFGTAADVAAIAVAMLDPRRLGLAADALDPMLNPVADVDGARTVGFLLAKDSESVRGVLPDAAVGHMGFTGTSLWIDAARRRLYVLLANRVHPVVPSVPFTSTRRGFHELAATR